MFGELKRYTCPDILLGKKKKKHQHILLMLPSTTISSAENQMA